MMLYNLQAGRCPRTNPYGDAPALTCGGNLFTERIEGVTEVVCLRCGARQQLGHTPTTERPTSGGGNEIKRWRRGQ